MTRYNSCPAPSSENLSSEVFLDHYDQTGYDKSKKLELKDFFADNEEGDNLTYSIVTQPPAGITASFGTNSAGDATLILSVTSAGATSGTTVLVRADDGQGGQADWTLTVYSIEVTGFEVQELHGPNRVGMHQRIQVQTGTCYGSMTIIVGVPL